MFNLTSNLIVISTKFFLINFINTVLLSESRMFNITFNLDCHLKKKQKSVAFEITIDLLGEMQTLFTYEFSM